MKNMKKQFIAQKNKAAAFVARNKSELTFLAGAATATLVSIGTAAAVNQRTWDKAETRMKSYNEDAITFRKRNGEFGYVLMVDNIEEDN